MKNSHIFWGVLFVTLGIAALLNNFFSLQAEWWTIFKLWPLFLIILGIALVVQQKLLKGILLGLTAALIALAIFAGIKSAFHFADHEFVINWEDEDYDFDWDSISDSTVFIEQFDSTINSAKLNIDAGAGRFIIGDTTSSLFLGKVSGSHVYYKLDSKIHDNFADLHLRFKGKKIKFTDDEIENNIKIALNPNPAWEINGELGAASMDFDFSPYKVKDLNIDMGAAYLKLKLGDKYNDLNCMIDGGASRIEIHIPENSGCEIKSDAALSSLKMEGFKKNDDDVYRTENFESSTNKIYIDLETGLSSITVKRY